jgi:hypothetical protein
MIPISALLGRFRGVVRVLEFPAQISAVRARARYDGAMSTLDQLLVRHNIDPGEAEQALRRVLEPSVPLTAAQLGELADSGFNLDARIDTDRALRDEALRQRRINTAYTGAEVASNNHISAGRVRNKAAAGELVSLLVDGAQRFPRFQFDEIGRIIRGLDKVSPHVPEDWSWVGYSNYLRTPSMELDGRTATPIEWLSAGKAPSSVVANMGSNW